jgi:GBP family porin
MKKSSIHMACIGSLLSLCAAGAQAQSQVTIYGIASLEALQVTGVNTGTNAAPVIGKQTRLDNSKVTNSRLGFRGTEDLGGGLSAVFGLESAIALDTGAQANATKFFNRGSFVGLKSESLGTLTLGRQWDLEDSVMSRYFIGGGYTVFQFAEFGYISDLVDNAVKYVSPNLGGLSLQALAAPGEGVTGPTREVAANYVAGPFEIGGTYRTSENQFGQKDKQSGLGASYKLGDVRLHAGWAGSDPKALGLRKARAYDLGVVWDATPSTSFTLDYVKRDQLKTRDDSYFVRLQGTYQLSKRTALFANLVTMKNKGTANQKFYGNGAPGQDQNVYSLGIRHSF